jgi:glutathione S-transferase
VACEIHPLNNLRVLKYLTRELKVDEDTKNTWYRHWVRDGLEAFERELQANESLRAAAGLPRPRTASATRRRWPTAASCRRSSTASASTSTLPA